MDDKQGTILLQDSINVANADHDEEEDIEEQLRRQQEIHNLLAVAMDEFNYDDQSTINSSLDESNNKGLPKLQQCLETANKQIENLEKKISGLENALRKSYDDKENVIVEKNNVIFSLTYSIQDAQKQCKELLETMEALGNDNALLRDALSKAEAQIDNAQVKILNETINKNRKLLEEKDLEIGNLKDLLRQHQEATKSVMNRSIQADADDTQKQLSHIIDERDRIQLANNELQHKLADATTELSNAYLDNNGLQRKLADAATELSKARTANNELQRKLDDATAELSEANQEIIDLERKHSVTENRELVIKDLQNQAAKLEEIILKQQKYLVNASTNTDLKIYDEDDINRLVEEKLLKHEIDLRSELQEELCEKIKKIETTGNADRYVKMIDEQKKFIEVLKVKIIQERQLMADALNKWSIRFADLEEQLRKNNEERFIANAELAEYDRNEEKLQNMLRCAQKEKQALLKSLKASKAITLKILLSGHIATNILDRMHQADCEVYQIEDRFSKYGTVLNKQIG